MMWMTHLNHNACFNTMSTDPIFHLNHNGKMWQVTKHFWRHNFHTPHRTHGQAILVNWQFGILFSIYYLPLSRDLYYVNHQNYFITKITHSSNKSFTFTKIQSFTSWAYQFIHNSVSLIQKGNFITHQIQLTENVSTPSKNCNLNPCLTSLPDYEQAHSLPLSSYQHKIRTNRQTQNKIERKNSLKVEKYELK